MTETKKSKFTIYDRDAFPRTEIVVNRDYDPCLVKLTPYTNRKLVPEAFRIMKLFVAKMAEFEKEVTSKHEEHEIDSHYTSLEMNVEAFGGLIEFESVNLEDVQELVNDYENGRIEF